MTLKTQRATTSERQEPRRSRSRGSATYIVLASDGRHPTTGGWMGDAQAFVAAELLERLRPERKVRGVRGAMATQINNPKPSQVLL